MRFSDVRRSLQEMARPSGQGRRKKTRVRFAPGGLESLEIRVVPAVSTWTGAVSGLWSNPANWDVAPAAGNDLTFPSGAAHTSNTNDLANISTFGTLTVGASGYSIGGGAVTLSGTIHASQTSGSSTVSLPISVGATTQVAVDQSAASLILSGIVSGAGGVDKTGPGSLQLAGTNTYTGTTTVDGGTLQVDGSQASSAVTVNSGATLDGIGTVASIAAFQGTVAPGDSGPGRLTDAGAFTLGNGSAFGAVLNGSNAGTDYSQLSAAGQINLNNANLNLSVGFTPTIGQTFTIVNNTGSAAINGTFAGLPQGATVNISGHAFTISYQGGDGNDLVLTAVTSSTGATTSSTSLQTSATSTVYGQGITLTATVTGSGTPSGTVEFLRGSTVLGTATVTNGVATFSTSALPVGTDSVTAVYLGDSTFASSTSAASSVTVSQASTTTALTASPTSGTVGTSILLTATVAPTSPGTGTTTGSVQFLNGANVLATVPLTNGTATFTTTTLPVGTNTLTAKYVGDTNYVTSTSTNVSVNILSKTTTTLSPASGSLVFGQSQSLTATVTGTSPNSNTPTGTVQFFSGSTSLGTATLAGGVATFSTTALPVGTDSVTAVYLGDSNFGTSTSSASTFTVTQSTATAVVSSATNPSVAGQSLILTATVNAGGSGSGKPTGNVSFFSGSTLLGTAALSNTIANFLYTGFLPAGNNAITAQYQGDANFQAVTSGAFIQNVSQGPTVTTLTATNSRAVNQPVTITAFVSPVFPANGSPTGSVTFSANGKVLGTAAVSSNGTATFTTSSLTIGNDTITAQYQGDSNFTASNATPLPVFVGTTTQRYVNQVYLDTFHEPATVKQINFWTRRLNRGYPPRKFVQTVQKQAARTKHA